jgi:hypothetical protein
VSSSSLVRLGGLAVVVAAVLLLTADIIDAYNIDAYTGPPNSTGST